MTEVWKEIEGWPDYAVSDLGRVKRTTDYGRGKAGTIRTPVYVAGYAAVTLTHRSGARKMLTIHSLVAKAFLGPPPVAGMEVNHIDADRRNPALVNLEWVTRGQNRKHGYEVGYADAKGERNGHARLTEERVRDIRSSTRSREQLAHQHGVSKATIRDVQSGRTWSHLLAA
jgi:hypothetical protein